MGDLKDFVIAAHGGLHRWNQLSEVRAHLLIGGVRFPSPTNGRRHTVRAWHEANTHIGPIDRACLRKLIKKVAAQRPPCFSGPRGWPRTRPAASTMLHCLQIGA